MKKYSISLLAAILILSSCTKEDNSSNDQETIVNENPASFKEIGSLTIGGTGAAEISAYDGIKEIIYCQQ
jgi:PBP1b-binding outer membrane lipoprotein LpoB